MASIETERNYREGCNDRFNAWDSYYGAHFVYAGAGDDIISLLFLSGEQTTVFGDVETTSSRPSRPMRLTQSAFTVSKIGLNNRSMAVEQVLRKAGFKRLAFFVERYE